MPRNVRNFWLELDVDGRASTITGGPISKDGGFSLTVFIRDQGSVTRALTVTGRAVLNGAGDGSTRLMLDVDGALDAIDVSGDVWTKRIVATR